MSVWCLVLIIFFSLVLNVVMVPGFSSAGEYNVPVANESMPHPPSPCS